MTIPSEPTADREVIQGLWLGSSRDKVYTGQVDAVLSIGPAGVVPIEDGVRHRHIDSPETIEQERSLAHWLTGHWFSGKEVLVRAEPLHNGERVCAMVLMQLGSEEREAAQLLQRTNASGGER